MHTADTDVRKTGWANAFTVFCYWAVMGVSCLFTSWIVFLRLDDGLQIAEPKLLMFGFLAALLLGMGIFAYRHQNRKRLAQPKACMCLAVAAGILGVCVRIAFLGFGGSYMPDGHGSDTGIHWYIAQEILESGKIQSYQEGMYEALFPYLTTYTMLISAMMKIFGVCYAAILIPNIVSDVIAAAAIYGLLIQWKNQRAASFAVVLWMLNPLGILFCAEGLAISITNMFLALAFCLVYFLWQAFQKKDRRKTVLSAVGTGLVFGLGNAFRVLFPVLLIALVFMLFVYCMQDRKHRTVIYALGAGMIITVIMMGCNFALTAMHQHVNPYYTQKHGSLGWSMFVGANYQSQGRWSFEDWDRMPPRLYEGGMTPKEVNEDFTKMAWERYKNMSVSQFGVHILNKTRVLFERNDIAIFKNLGEQFCGASGLEQWIARANVIGLAALTVFAVLQFLFFTEVLKEKKHPDWFLFFLALCFCGLLLSSLLVEVMSRYVSIFLVLFVIFSTCAAKDVGSYSMDRNSNSERQE